MAAGGARKWVNRIAQKREFFGCLPKKTLSAGLRSLDVRAEGHDNAIFGYNTQMSISDAVYV